MDSLGEGGLHTVIGVAPLGEPTGDRGPLEDGAMSEAQDACLESAGSSPSERACATGRRACRRALSSWSAEQPDGHPPAGCDTHVVEGVPHDAEDCSFSCRVGPTAAGHGLRGLSSCRRGTRSRLPHVMRPACRAVGLLYGPPCCPHGPLRESRRCVRA